jgi:hypothetical protein
MVNQEAEEVHQARSFLLDVQAAVADVPNHSSDWRMPQGNALNQKVLVHSLLPGHLEHQNLLRHPDWGASSSGREQVGTFELDFQRVLVVFSAGIDTSKFLDSQYVVPRTLVQIREWLHAVPELHDLPAVA